MIAPDLIDSLGDLFRHDGELKMATVGAPLGEAEYNEPSAVKVICNLKGQAMYFSRSLIPYPRNAFVNAPLSISAFMRIPEIFSWNSRRWSQRLQNLQSHWSNCVL